MITELAQGATHLVADNDFGDNLGDGVAGPVGLLVIVLLAVGTVLLVRNMNKRLRRLPESFPDPRDQQDRDQQDRDPQGNLTPGAPAQPLIPTQPAATAVETTPQDPPA